MNISRLASRISVRLALFNLLVVFLPVAGVLFLGSYEQNLEQTQIDSMQRQARLIVAALQSGSKPPSALANVRFGDERIRIVSPSRRVVADTGPLTPAENEPESPAHANWLYRIGAAILTKPMQWLRPITRPLASSDAYEQSPVLRGPEIDAAFVGQTGVEKRVSSAPGRQVTLYTAVPMYQRGNVIGAVLVSQTTDDIRDNIHTVRLAILQILLAAVIVATVLTLLVSTTIVQPLRQLRKEAAEIADPRGRLRGRFKGSNKRDEIGDLARALERLSRRLEQHQQSTEAFASDVSHEFKNPLASVRMATEMLAQVDAPAERARFLRVAESEIARMENLMAQVREITMIDTDIQKEQRTAVDVNALLQRIVEGFRMREKERIAFDLELAPAPLEAAASEDRLLQVFENLLDNAASFTPDGKRITITSAREDGVVLVRIADEGPGIPEENLTRIFDRFFTYRPDHPATQRHAGLGLSIVKAIVEGYGGNTTAANGVRGGAVFEIRLPVSS
ncbi:MAG TPA: ATP-binding protein [Thermoanaerobaculia bacterium]|nr:ATP-binding protein [Thermoanaerobaculia bacterium]